MRDSGSKRTASSSPKRKTKRHRDDCQENPSSDDSSEKSEDKPLPSKSGEGGAERNDTSKGRNKRDKKSRQRKNDETSGSRESSPRSGREDSDGGSRSTSSSEKEVDCGVKQGGRYWGGEEEKPTLEEGELMSRSREPDYEVGPRYYDFDKPKDKDSEKEGKKSDEKYVVGKRYYGYKESSLADDAKAGDADKAEGSKGAAVAPTRRAKLDDPLLSRTGGAYIPPAKLRLMQASITDKSSVSYQRIAWEALKKSIHGHINKVNTSNIGVIARLLMKENIIRGRGLLSRSLLQAQAASPTFTNVYACLVSVINSKFPNIGELIMKRVILQFKRGFKRNDKALCIASCQFVAHLVNQQVAHEILALEMLTLLLESPTDDSVEVAVAFLKEVGQKLLELSPKGTNAIFDMLRNILHQGNLEKRVQYMIEVVFQVRKDGFRSFESVDESLDLVEEEDRYTHILTLDEAVDPEDLLNVFKHDLEYEANEDKYKALKEEIIGGSSSEEESGDEGSDDEESAQEDSDDQEQEQAKETKSVTVIDETETNLVALRRTIYLTIQSSLDFQECCHKLLKMDIKPGQEKELCHMLLDCCAELRTYEKFFGLLAQRFCQINRIYIPPLEEMFAGSYATVHRLDTNKLRNVARFFGHLLFTDAISWQVLESVRLNEEETTSSSRIFIKILFQELAEYMGLSSLNQRLKDPTLQTAMEGLFPRDNPKNTRFAINFFTSIGLGGLTDELREHLKTQPKPSAVAQLVDKLNESSESESSSSSSDSSSDSSDSESSSSESSSDSENNKPRKRKKIKKQSEKKKKEVEKQKPKEDGKDKAENDLRLNDKRTKLINEEQQRKQDTKDNKNGNKRYERNDTNKTHQRDDSYRRREKQYSDESSTRDKEQRDQRNPYSETDRESDRRNKRKDRDYDERHLEKRSNPKENIKKTNREQITAEDTDTKRTDKENRKKQMERHNDINRRHSKDTYKREEKKDRDDPATMRKGKVDSRERSHQRDRTDKHYKDKTHSKHR